MPTAGDHLIELLAKEQGHPPAAPPAHAYGGAGETTDTHELLKAAMFHTTERRCSTHFDKSRPCPTAIYGISDAYPELDSWAKATDRSDFERGRIVFNFAVAGGTRDDAIGVRTEVPTAIEMLVEPFTVGLPDDLYTEGAADAAVAAAAAVHVSQSVRAGTTGALAASTYDNGTSGVGATLTADVVGVLADQDGITLIVGDDLLVKNQASTLENGVYSVTSIGSVGTSWILTRSTSADTTIEILTGYRTISEGTTLADDTYHVAIAAITIGTDAITWVAGLPSAATVGGSDPDSGAGAELSHGFSQLPFGGRATLQFEEFGRQARLGRDPHAASERGHQVEFDTAIDTDRLVLTPLSGERGYFVFTDPIQDVHNLTAVFRGVDRPLVLPADVIHTTVAVSSGNLLFTWTSSVGSSASAMPPLSAADRIFVRDFASDAGNQFDNYVNRPDGHLVGTVPSGSTFTLNPSFSGLTLTVSSSVVRVSIAKNRVRINLRIRSVLGRLTNYISP
jgi:hypothetical protein